MARKIQLKRAYDPPAKSDGYRALVDALWPRGVAKAELAAEWHKELAPSAALRKWYGHDVAHWPEFRKRYLAELADPARQDSLAALLRSGGRGPLTLVYAARDTEHNNAAVLREALLDLAGQRTAT